MIQRRPGSGRTTAKKGRSNVAFGSLTGLISGFVVTLAVCLVVLGAAKPDSGLKLSIPGTHHRSESGAGVTDDSATTTNDGSGTSLPIGTTPADDSLPGAGSPSASSGSSSGSLSGTSSGTSGGGGTPGGPVTAPTRPATGSEGGSGHQGGAGVPVAGPGTTPTDDAPVITPTQDPTPSPVLPPSDPETPAPSDPAAAPVTNPDPSA